MHKGLVLSVTPVLRSTCALLILLAGFVAVSPAPAHAQSNDLDQKVREIGSVLRCPVCRNLSVADSPSPLASEMRGVIREKLQAGESREAIINYFVARYGEEIMLDPPREGFTLFLWLGSLGLVAAGLFIMAVRVRRALISVDDIEPDAANTGAEDPRYAKLLDAELVRYKQEVR